MEYNFEGSDPEQIEGTVESITYRNETNGYSVFKFNCDYGEITAVGQFSALSAGDMLRLEGFSRHIKSTVSSFMPSPTNR